VTATRASLAAADNVIVFPLKVTLPALGTQRASNPSTSMAIRSTRWELARDIAESASIVIQGPPTASQTGPYDGPTTVGGIVTTPASVADWGAEAFARQASL
jgi:hypothetical protein